MSPEAGEIFTSPLAVASSFNRNLAREVGQAIGNEVRHKGNDVVHAPTLDVVRIYTSGRVFETFGEDPYLVSQMGLEWMQGVESEGIGVHLVFPDDLERTNQALQKIPDPPKARPKAEKSDFWRDLKKQFGGS